MVFYKLYIERRKDPLRYVPAWEFGGEMFVKEKGLWVLMSYKCPTRLTELYQENPNLLERSEIVGKSGSKYFGYRFRENCQPKDIVDKGLREFYQVIKRNEPAEEDVERFEKLQNDADNVDVNSEEDNNY